MSESSVDDKGCVVFFFFQTEDGIRDLVRSRGLGDVYKRRTLVTPVSSCKINCVLRAIRDEVSVGRAIASSKLFVCNDCVPPKTADMASKAVRTILLYGSCF